MQPPPKVSTTPPPVIQAPATPPPQPNRELFHKRLPSAIKVTNVEQAKQLLQLKINEGFRWVTPGFIIDAKYNIGETTLAPTTPEDFGLFDLMICDIQLTDNKGTYKLAYYVDERNNISKIRVPYSMSKETLKTNLDTNNDYKFLINTKNPVAKAKQMPDIAAGDWVVIEGKTMRLVKANDQKCQDLEMACVNAQIQGLNIQTAGNPEAQLSGINLPEDFFPDSYTRMAGAYIRRLERFQHLKPVFYRFFKVSEFDSSDPAKKHPTINSISISLFGRTDTKYTKLQIAILKLDPLTLDDLKLIKKALGVTIDPAVLNATPPPTIANVVTFKKILEILTYYNPESNIPMLAIFKVGSKMPGFVLSPDDQQPSQLIVSGQSSDKNGDVKCEGHAYPWWMNNYQGSGSPVSAQEANSILNRPLSETTSITPKTLEFLACTQIVESHFTPGKLNSSRVPGSGKLARAVVRRHVTPTVTDLSTSFDAQGKTPYPMAAAGGTGNTRRAVNSLRRDGGTRAENTHAYDMSDDSDVDG